MESGFFMRTNKRKISCDSNVVKKRVCYGRVMPEIMQERIQEKFNNTGVQTLSSRHCKLWPIAMHPIDGVKDIIPVTKQNPCSKCISGQSGHWSHVQ